MKYVQENLEQYRDKKFFSELQKRAKLYEADLFSKNGEDKKVKKEKTKKEVDPKKEQEAKLAAMEEKDALDVIKKVKDNFNRFKSAAGGKIGSYKEFWNQQSAAIAELQKKDPSFKQAYILYDSVYVVATKNVEGVISLNVIDRGEGVIYSTTNDKAIDEFTSFVAEIKKEMKGAKDHYIKTVENKKKEEEQKAKKEKLDKFLKEEKEEKKTK